ncbi:MAG: DUF1638 domain-containing protein [Armatimonadota bacterium]
MRFRIIACGVFEPYLRRLAQEVPHGVDLRVLDAGLHSRPNDLRLLLQSEIDEASRQGVFDAVVLMYGLCGRGAADLVSRDIRVVIPRAHDCSTLFLGSPEAYLRQFRAHPGTIYHTLGWITKKINPRDREAAELYLNYEKIGYDKHPEFRDLQERFGEENAHHILAFFDRWKQHYTRAAYIDLGFPDEDALVELTRKMAGAFGWEFELIKGDANLMHKILSGDWSDPRIFVLPPDSRCVSTGDDRVFAAVAIDAGDQDTALTPNEVVIESGDGGRPLHGIGLGIDAGGTYTDAVVYDLGERKVLAKAKSLTTYHNLVDGIRGALSQLPPKLVRRVRVTSLSTTLATNSIVEGRGCKVGLIALSPWDWTPEQVGHSPMVNVPGAVSITGEILEELDEDACRRAARRLVEEEHCAAIVIAGYATVRNPVLANRAREVVLEVYDVPVICSHEVSRRLNAIHGAQTAIANARLLPVIRDLIDSVHEALADFKIPGRLMVVKGDGSPVDEHIARARPVETILSGPAASASGARMLTGFRDALVVDIGGTTTDCAILTDGHVAVCEDGARIGSWTMGVDAVEISTVGLGGDSRIDFTGDRRITVGPRRNIPFAYLVHEYRSVEEFLNSFDPRRYAKWTDAAPLDVLILAANAADGLTDREKALVDLLSSGPVLALQAADSLELPSPRLLPLSRLEDWGVVKRGGLTPTDLLHVTGAFTRWSVDAARKALEAFAVMYGASPEDVLRRAMDVVIRRLFEEIVRREVAHESRKIHEIPDDWKFLISKAFRDDGVGLGVRFSLRRPVVAIGAPAAALVPPVADHLDCKIVVPEHADVANAIGAIASEITVREEILIRPGDTSNYVLHGSEERIEFTELDRATQAAVSIVRERARKKAIEAGAFAPEVTVTRHDALGTTDGGGQIFLQRRITAIASGGAFTGKRR